MIIPVPKFITKFKENLWKQNIIRINKSNIITYRINDQEEIWLNGKKLDPKSKEYKEAKIKANIEVKKAMKEVDQTLASVAQDLRRIFK